MQDLPTKVSEKNGEGDERRIRERSKRIELLVQARAFLLYVALMFVWRCMDLFSFLRRTWFDRRIIDRTKEAILLHTIDIVCHDQLYNLLLELLLPLIRSLVIVHLMRHITDVIQSNHPIALRLKYGHLLVDHGFKIECVVISLFQFLKDLKHLFIYLLNKFLVLSTLLVHEIHV